MNSPNEDQRIKSLLTQYKKIAVVGLSPDPWRPSHGVTEYMIKKGYTVSGVRPPPPAEILGRPCYAKLSDVPQPLEIVNVFRAVQFIPEIVDEVIALSAKVLWLQEGIADPVSEQRARAAGVEVVSDRCILKEHSRLFR